MLHHTKSPGRRRVLALDCSSTVQPCAARIGILREDSASSAHNSGCVAKSLARSRAAARVGAVVAVLLAGASAGPAWAQAAQAGAPTSTASPAREYREALAAGDSTRAAAALTRMWRGRLTEDRLRGLNERLKVQSDDRTVAAVVLEVARLQGGAVPAPAAAGGASAPPAPEPNGYKLLNWLASNFRPAQPAQTAPQVPSTAAAEDAPAQKRAPVRTAAKAANTAPPKKQRVRSPENPAIAYETALLARDPTGMARAAARLTGGRVTAETVHKLNAEIGAEPDEKLVRAVLEAAPAAKAD